MAIRTSEWRKLPLSLTELCIDTTLRCGQSFRWRKISDEWHCTLHGRIVSLRQDPDHLHYKATWPTAATAPPTPPASSRGITTPDEPPPDDDTEALLRNYFNLHHDLAALYRQWAAADPNFRRRAPAFAGVRMLNQDAWEALVGFICSSNNNIARISQMVHKLCLHYGPHVGTVAGEQLHDFPNPQALTGPGVEAHLRALGFGYRARYIAETARTVARERPAGWLHGLRNPASAAWGATATVPPKVEAAADAKEGGGDDQQQQQQQQQQHVVATYKHAHEQLLQLTGVGPKVADCVCLMGLGWGEAVPVDTHVWQIAMRDYRFGGGSSKNKSKTLTKALYDAVGDHFRALWGAQAGWAHSVLFTADLKAFSERGAEDKEKKKKKMEEEEEGGADGDGEDAAKAVKVEAVEGVLVTPVATPRATPAKKRRRAAVDTGVKIEVKEEEDEVDAESAMPRKRRTTRSSLR